MDKIFVCKQCHEFCEVNVNDKEASEPDNCIYNSSHISNWEEMPKKKNNLIMCQCENQTRNHSSFTLFRLDGIYIQCANCGGYYNINKSIKINKIEPINTDLAIHIGSMRDNENNIGNWVRRNADKINEIIKVINKEV